MWCTRPNVSGTPQNRRREKEMEHFHDLVGAAEDEAELLDAALNTAKKKRIVVKRPRLGEFPRWAQTCLSIHRQKHAF